MWRMEDGYLATANKTPIKKNYLNMLLYILTRRAKKEGTAHVMAEKKAAIAANELHLSRYQKKMSYNSSQGAAEAVYWKMRAPPHLVLHTKVEHLTTFSGCVEERSIDWGGGALTMLWRQGGITAATSGVAV